MLGLGVHTGGRRRLTDGLLSPPAPRCCLLPSAPGPPCLPLPCGPCCLCLSPAPSHPPTPPHPIPWRHLWVGEHGRPAFELPRSSLHPACHPVCCTWLWERPAFWAFLWFVGFCFLANQWQVSKPKDNPLNEGTDAARAAIAFSFFSIFTWVSTALRIHTPGPGGQLRALPAVCGVTDPTSTLDGTQHPFKGQESRGPDRKAGLQDLRLGGTRRPSYSLEQSLLSWLLSSIWKMMGRSGGAHKPGCLGWVTPACPS